VREIVIEAQVQRLAVVRRQIGQQFAEHRARLGKRVAAVAHAQYVLQRCALIACARGCVNDTVARP